VRNVQVVDIVSVDNMITPEEYDIAEAKLSKLTLHLTEETEVFGMEVGDSLCIDGWFTIPQLVKFAELINEVLGE